MSEAIERFRCFGSYCEVFVIGDGPLGCATEAVRAARRELSHWHAQFSRFIATSELSRLNADLRRAVPGTALMARFAQAVVLAGELSGGLVDATKLAEIERAGYAQDLGEPVPLQSALALAPPRRPARADPAAHWRSVEVAPCLSVVSRPPGVQLDSGGLAKGMFADVLSERLAAYPSFAINCGGDLIVAGARGVAREVAVQSPFDGSVLHSFELSCAAAATSGIGRRSWIARDGSPAHHLLDPATGRPAFTGVLQATALAPTALLAEIHAKAALLAGPHAARRHLPHGGLLVLHDGGQIVIEPPRQVTLREFSAYA